jgi:hypothetical protein
MKLSIVGIPWYHKETYRAARALFIDGAKLPAAYDAWLKGALEAESKVKANGQTAIRAYIDPIAFRIWCEQRGLAPDFSARSAFAHARARDEFTRSMAAVDPVAPSPVRVVFPDGYAETGMQITPTVVELSPAGVELQLRDPLQIDGRRVSIVAKTVRFNTAAGSDSSAEGTVRITFEELKA